MTLFRSQRRKCTSVWTLRLDTATPGAVPKTEVTERHFHPKYPRLRVELRTDSKFSQAVTRLDSKLRQHSTRSTNLSTALRLAEDWYRRDVKASAAAARQHPLDSITKDPTVAGAWASYERTLGDKKQTYANGKWNPICAVLAPTAAEH